jgi:formiminotetrahydrofolate cyclodeaminase
LSTALQGALANVNINLDELRDRGAEVGDIEAAVRELAR